MCPNALSYCVEILQYIRVISEVFLNCLSKKDVKSHCIRTPKLPFMTLINALRITNMDLNPLLMHVWKTLKMF